MEDIAEEVSELLLERDVGSDFQYYLYNVQNVLYGPQSLSYRFIVRNLEFSLAF